MDKLIKLLNEYKGDKFRGKFKYNEKSNVFFRGEFDDYDEIKECELISKKYGFIKWLVENKKIEELEETDYLEDYYGGTFSEYQDRIMMLSISDNPIQDLCNLLK